MAIQNYISCTKDWIYSDIVCLEDGIMNSKKKRISEAFPESQIYIFNSRIKGHAKFSFRMIFWLMKHICEYDLIYVHALFSPTSTFSMLVSRIRKVPYIIRPLGTLSRYTLQNGRKFIKSMYFNFFEKSNVQKAGLVHFTSELEYKLALEVVNVSCYSIIPIPVNLVKIPEKNQKRTILYFSRIDRKKNLELLLEAFKIFSKKHGNIHLVIAGNGSKKYTASIRQKVSDLELSEKVEFKGHVLEEEKFSVFHDAICMALISENENFGIAVAEALGAGIPVVISRGVAMWSEIEACGAGIVVEKEIDKISAALEFFTENQSEREQASNAAIEYVQKNYSQSRIGSLLYSACEKVLLSQ